MSFIQSLSKGSSSKSNTSTQTSQILADRLASSSSSSSSQQHQDFRTPTSAQPTTATDAEYSEFTHDRTSTAIQALAAGPYSLLPLDEQAGVSDSSDVEFQRSIDGLDVVGLLEVMDTAETEMDAFVVGRGGEKRLDDGAEVEDPVEWLGITTEYTDEVWGDGEGGDGRKRGGGGGEVKESKGKGKAVDMKSRL
ncbi:hypothetical protein DRE_00971 [Drechslerella stenobrocha 248]|uniref:Uncharacterized protein n=1 Tax=Drechslerella stenobrocha 248 TaxID=1043628 RepID=W7HXP4_9PEZI|nr:hypothetical protein DRE_00971 [Drechslerella stenobrocha 248]